MRYGLLLSGAMLCLGAHSAFSQTKGAVGAERSALTLVSEGHTWWIRSVETEGAAKEVSEAEKLDHVAKAGRGHTPTMTLLFSDSANGGGVAEWATMHGDTKNPKPFDAEVREAVGGSVKATWILREARVVRLTREGAKHSIRLELECEELRKK